MPEEPQRVVYPPFDELTMLIYGPQGTGKTTFFGASNAVMILATEPGSKFQHARMRAIHRWAPDANPDPKLRDTRLDFLTMINGIIEAAREGKMRRLGVKLVVIDTVDALFEMAKWKGLETYHRVNPKGARYEHPDHLPWGNSAKYAMKEFTEAIKRLMAVTSVAFISHEKLETKEAEDASGVKAEIEKRVPSVAWQCAEWLAGIQNLVGYAYQTAGGQFFMKFNSDARLETKDRTGLLEANRRPIKNGWADVVAVYEAQAAKRGVALESRWK